MSASNQPRIRGGRPKLGVSGIALGVVVVGGSVAYVYLKTHSPTPTETPQVEPALPQNWPAPQDLQRRPAPVEAAPAAVVAPAPAPSPAPAAPTAPPQAAALEFSVWSDDQAIKQAQSAAASRYQSKLTERQTMADAMRGGKGAGDPNANNSSSGEQSPYSKMLQSTNIEGTKPVPPDFNPMYTIKEGTIFSCTSSQPLDTSLPGNTRCFTGPDPVMSMDGTTVLLPKFTQINGRIERGLVNGQQRTALVVTSALTPNPDNKKIPLNTYAADDLGQSGVPLDVETHFGRRLGHAFAFGLVDMLSSSASAAAQGATSGSQGGNNYLNFNGLSNGVQSLSQSEYQRDAQIAPTGTRPGGYTYTIYINHDIDLSLYYHNRIVR